MNEQVFDLLASALDQECIHLLTVRTCTLCKDRLFNRAYAKTYGSLSKKADKSVIDTEKHPCALCQKRKPTSKNRATIRLPRSKHGVLEHHFGVRVGDNVVVNPWCNHAEGKCICADPPTMSGPTVEVPKVHPATHQLHDGRWVCDECCDGHCQRCLTKLPEGRRGQRVGYSLDGAGHKRNRLNSLRTPSAAELFG